MSSHPTVYFAFLGGLWILAHSIRDYRAVRRAARWPSVRGHIIESQVLDIKRGIFTDHPMRVRYTYELDGAKIGFTPRLGCPEFINLKKLRAYAASYPVGKAVEVFYNPSQPDMTCLERASSVSVLARLGLGALIVLLGLLVILFAR